MQAIAEKIPTAGPIQFLLKALSQASRLIQQKRSASEVLEEVKLLLESLPLTTDEYSLANNRLRNAGRFVRSCEFGAALWELRTLRIYIARQSLAVQIVPRQTCWTR